MEPDSDLVRETQWYSISNPPGVKPAPEWGRRFGVDETGEMWVPAALGSGEMEVFLCASFDNEPVLLNDEHIFVRASWLAREFPVTAGPIENMRANVAEKFGKVKTPE